MEFVAIVVVDREFWFAIAAIVAEFSSATLKQYVQGNPCIFCGYFSSGSGCKISFVPALKRFLQLHIDIVHANNFCVLNMLPVCESVDRHCRRYKNE